MNKYNINSIQRAEELLFPTENPVNEFEYRKFDYYWIRRKNWPLGLVREMRGIPGLRYKPVLNLKKWGHWLFGILGNKREKKYNLQYLLGPLLAWSFLPRCKIPIEPDFVILRSSVLSIYNSNEDPFVLKISFQKSSLKESLEKEVKLLKNISTLKFPKPVNIPNISFSRINSNLAVYKINLIKGITLNEIKLTRRQYYLNKVAEFMVEFYLSTGLSLGKPRLSLESKEIHLLKKIIELEPKCERISHLINQIYEKPFLMVKSIVHKDLTTGNIIIDENNLPWLIDWGAAKRDYIVFDLDDSYIHSSKLFYTSLIRRSNIDSRNLYSYQEQVFIKKIESLGEKLMNNLRKDEILRLKQELVDYSINVSAG